MKPLIYGLFLILFLSLTQCGGTDVGGGAEPVGRDPVKVYLFGAGWCENCHRDFPKIEGLVSAEAENTRQRLQTEVYIVEGAKGKEPTQETADQEKTKMNLTFEVKPDPWRWTTFLTYFKKNEMRLPAAVVLNKNGEILKKFSAGFAPEELVGYAKEQLK